MLGGQFPLGTAMSSTECGVTATSGQAFCAGCGSDPLVGGSRQPRTDAVGITMAALVAAFAFLLVSCGASGGSSSTPPALTSGPGTFDSLDRTAGDCGVRRVGGGLVTFAGTAIPSGVSVDRRVLCGLARNAASRDDQTVRKQLETMCQGISRMAGTSNFAALVQKYGDAATDPDPAKRQAFASFVECANKGKAIRSASAGYGIRIYSVGMSTFAGTSCLGYLQEMSGMKEAGGTTSYFLFGTGSCASRDFQDQKAVFQPEANPSGKPPGDVIRNEFAYTGELPKQWVYKGRTYPFGGQQADSSKTLSARSNETTTTQGDAGIPKGAAETADELAEQQALADQKAISGKCNASPDAQRQCDIEWCRERGLPEECRAAGGEAPQTSGADTPPLSVPPPTPSKQVQDGWTLIAVSKTPPQRQFFFPAGSFTWGTTGILTNSQVRGWPEGWPGPPAVGATMKVVYASGTESVQTLYVATTASMCQAGKGIVVIGNVSGLVEEAEPVTLNGDNAVSKMFTALCAARPKQGDKSDYEGDGFNWLIKHYGSK